VGWTGRAIREDKKLAIPAELSLTLERIGLNPEAWVSSVRNYNRHYFSVLGVIDCIKAYGKMQERELATRSAGSSAYLSACHCIVEDYLCRNVTWNQNIYWVSHPIAPNFVDIAVPVIALLH
jgi:hypothetical protein